MADTDEDTIRVSGPDSDDLDPSDEVQDFSLLRKPSKPQSLPKRGEKSFEPYGTHAQSSRLAASRAAMHDQLAVGRAHNPKNHMLALYDPATNTAAVLRPKSQHFLTMGRVRGGRLWLLPEETLYLLERGTLDVRWPVEGKWRVGDEEEGEEGVPMSLQGAYAAFVGMEMEDGLEGWRLTLEKYVVYAGLKKAGYTVLRAEGYDEHEGPPSTAVEHRGWGLDLFAELWRRLFDGVKTCPPGRLALGPLVTPGLYRSHTDVYRLLHIIPFHNPALPQLPTSKPPSPPAGTKPRLRVTYHVHKPAPTFKKSDPGPPDYRICVVDARATTLPALSELSALLESTPYDPPKDGAQLYNKLKYGHRNVVLAVVDQGVVSYVRVADAGFGIERVYERAAWGGGKGRGGFRGRGRGRGRR